MTLSLRVELSANLGDTRDRGGAPFVDRDVDTQVGWVHWLEGLNRLSAAALGVHLEDRSDEDFHDVGVPEFPDGEGATLDKLFDAILTVLEYKFGSKTFLGHCPEDSSLDLLVDDLALELPVQYCSGCVAAIFNFDFSLQRDSVAGVTQAAQFSDFNLV